MKSPFINGELSSVFLRSIMFHVVAVCKSVTGKNNCWHAISINYKVKLFRSYCGLVLCLVFCFVFLFFFSPPN